METIKNSFADINLGNDNNKEEIISNVNEILKNNGYDIVELNSDKPWGAYFRMNNEQADRFIDDFFNHIDPKEARLGRNDVSLSPKILLVSPEQRLSWQYHHRRAERWTFLTEGAFHKSLSDEEGNINMAHSGDVVQFEAGERHRLVGLVGKYALVAEIWQHIYPDNPSDEDDIVRLQDDYSR